MVHGPAIHKVVVKTANQEELTIWTAPASPDVPLLAQLDMSAPLAGMQSAKEHAAKAKARVKTMLSFYVSRPSADSLRKLVK